MLDTIKSFAALQGVEIKKGAGKFSIRLLLPSKEINALMSDFIEQKQSVTWKVDEDGLFYAKCKSDNISLIIQEGKTFKIENVLPNQKMEEVFEGNNDLPGREPFIDHTKPVY